MTFLTPDEEEYFEFTAGCPAMASAYIVKLERMITRLLEEGDFLSTDAIVIEAKELIK